MNDRNRRILLKTYYAFLVNGVIGVIFGAIMPLLLKEYGLGYSMGGTILSAHSIGNFLSSFIFGALLTAIGRRKTVIILSSMAALGFGGLRFLSIPALLIIYCTMTGVGRGAISNISNTIISEVTEGNAKYLNILHSIYGVGAFLAPFFISVAIKKGFGLNDILLVVFLLVSIAILALGSIDLDKKSKTSEQGTVNFGFLKNKQFQLSSIMMFFYTGAEYAITGWLVTYLQDASIMNESTAQLMLSVFWIVMITGRLAAAYSSKNISKDTIILISSAMVIVLYVIFLVTKNPTTLIFIIMALGLSLAPLYPTIISTADNSIKKYQHAVSFLLAMAGLGGIIFPFTVGFVAERLGIFGGMAIIGVAMICLITASILNFKHKD